MTHGGRGFYVRGLDPEGVAPPYVYLEDATTGVSVQVLFGDEWPEPQEADGGLHLVGDDSEHNH